MERREWAVRGVQGEGGGGQTQGKGTASREDPWLGAIQDALKGVGADEGWNIEDERQKGGRDDSRSSPETRVAADTHAPQSLPWSRRRFKFISSLPYITSLNLHMHDIGCILSFLPFCSTEMAFTSIMRDGKYSEKINLANHQEGERILNLLSSEKIVTRCITGWTGEN